MMKLIDIVLEKAINTIAFYPAQCMLISIAIMCFLFVLFS
jgi:hypothetical protein